MSTITPELLCALMRGVASDAGIAEPELSRPGALDLSFPELGFDSLSLIELLEKIKDVHGIEVPQHVADSLTTPRQLLDFLGLTARRAG